jgi:hypothetical protein
MQRIPHLDLEETSFRYFLMVFLLQAEDMLWARVSRNSAAELWDWRVRSRKTACVYELGQVPTSRPSRSF